MSSRSLTRSRRQSEETFDRIPQGSISTLPSTRGRGRRRDQGRDRGRGKGKGRGRGRIVYEEEQHETPQLETIPSTSEAPEWAQNIQRAIDQLVNVLTQQRPPQTEPKVQTPPPPSPTRSDPTNFRNYMQEFQKLKPPRYSGVGSLIDPQLFVEQVESLWRVLECSEEIAVKLVWFQLDGTAADWFRAWMSGRLPGDPPVTWNAFQVAFLHQFLPEGERDAKVQEFISLKQERMTISEYAARFLHLSQFAGHLIPLEKDRARKFVEGLNYEYFQVIEVTENCTYEKVFNRAIELEVRFKGRRRERETQSESRKKFRFESTSRELRQQTFSTPNMSSTRRNDSQLSSRVSKLVGRSRAPTRLVPHSIRQMGRYGSSFSTPVRPKTFRGTLPTCRICGGTHTGICRRESRACFGCGEQGHLIRKCPHRTTHMSRGVTPSISGNMPSSSSASVRPPFDQSGRGGNRGSASRGCGAGRGSTARVYALT